MIPLRSLRFAGRFRGATPDHGERQVSDGGDAEGKEQAVVIEALDKGGVGEDAGEVRGGGRFEEAGRITGTTPINTAAMARQFQPFE